MNYPEPSGAFPPTLWSVVRLAVAEGKPGSDQALDEFCRQYERPILAYIRRTGHAGDAAEDLKQAFFEHLLGKNALAAAAEARVKLRAFLITKLQGFLIDRHRHEVAQKRGGGRVVRMADLSETQALLAEPVHEVTPVVAFQRQWMTTVASRAMQQLQVEYAQRGLNDLFTAIAPCITNAAKVSLAELSLRLGRPEGTLKSDISRLRSRCQKLIREQIAATLEDPTPENITAELRELMSAPG